MEFLVFRRTDGALVVVPAMFHPPLASRRGGLLTFDSVCDIDLDALSPDVVAALAQDGFACLRGPDWDLIEAAMKPSATTADG
ncbi:MAG: hypothetical protein ACOY37_08115 [Pseudomonadota bacterium]